MALGFQARVFVGAPARAGRLQVGLGQRHHLKHTAKALNALGHGRREVHQRIKRALLLIQTSAEYMIQK